MDLTERISKLLDALSNRDINRLITFYDEHVFFELVPEHLSIRGLSAWQKAAGDFFSWVEEGRKELLRSCQQNNTVWVERVDHWKINNTWISLPIMAVVEFTHEGKVLHWREYHTLEYRKQFENFLEFPRNT